MAERRQFSKTVIESDVFLSLPLDVQALYFHLNLHAIDNGIVINAHSIAKSLNLSGDIVEALVKAGFISKCHYMDFDGYIISHWNENNGIGAHSRERKTPEYRKWRSNVLSRDRKCVACGSTTNLVAHHIKPFARYPELRTELSNGITLCKDCHKKYHKENKNG